MRINNFGISSVVLITSNNHQISAPTTKVLGSELERIQLIAVYELFCLKKCKNTKNFLHL
jgi:hypothetical protein